MSRRLTVWTSGQTFLETWPSRCASASGATSSCVPPEEKAMSTEHQANLWDRYVATSLSKHCRCRNPRADRKFTGSSESMCQQKTSPRTIWSHARDFHEFELVHSLGFRTISRKKSLLCKIRNYSFIHTFLRLRVCVEIYKGMQWM